MARADTINAGTGNIYAFSPDHIFQQRYGVLHTNNGESEELRRVRSGTWSLRKNKLWLSDSISDLKDESSFTRYRIVSLTNNELVLRSKDKVNMHYERIPANAMPIKDSVAFYRRPDQKLYLINAADSTRETYIKTGTNLSVMLLTDNDSMKIELNGELLSVADSSFRIALYSLDKKILLEDGYKQNNMLTLDYNWENSSVKRKVYMINFSEVENISGATRNSSAIDGFFSPITGMSMFVALVVAPLASINYRTGEFNQNRYYWIAGSSLGLFTVTLPISIISQNRHRSFSIAGSGSAAEGGYWLLDNSSPSN